AFLGAALADAAAAAESAGEGSAGAATGAGAVSTGADAVARGAVDASSFLPPAKIAMATAMPATPRPSPTIMGIDDFFCACGGWNVSTVPSAAGNRNGVGAASGAASSAAFEACCALARALRSMRPESSLRDDELTLDVM